MPCFQSPDSSRRSRSLAIAHAAPLRFFIATMLLAKSLSSIHAAELGPFPSSFGSSLAQSGEFRLVGASRENSARGAVYVFQGYENSARLIASDRWPGDYFGNAVSLSGNIGLVGAVVNATSGSAYLYRNLDTATGTVTQDVKLSASVYTAHSRFGDSVSLDGTIALIGASNPTNGEQGAAYVFRNLDTAPASITEDVKLTASDGTANNYFGNSVSLSGKIGLVGADGDRSNRGAAYVFRNLDTAPASITENVKLTASDGMANDQFGNSVSLSGNLGVVVATGNNGGRGAAYVFQNLDTANGSMTESMKLIASDGAAADQFGTALSLSGNTALIGAPGDEGNLGSVYVFRNLDAAQSGTVIESLRITLSAAISSFGGSVNLAGDEFMIGSTSFFADTVYLGSVSSMSTLNSGNITRTIDGISFVSQDHWVIGKTTDQNQVFLSEGDMGNVTGSGKAVYIGQSAGSDHNLLAIAGALTAREVNIGSIAGNKANTLRLDSSAILTIDSISLAPENLLSIQGDYTILEDLFAYLGDDTLQAWNGGAWSVVDSENAALFITITYTDGYTTIEAIPEPSTWALLGLALGGVLVFRKRLIAG